MIRTLSALLLTLAVHTAPAVAQDFMSVPDEQAFRALIDGRELRIGLYNLSLRLAADGKIEGSAMGWGITGQWRWEDGYFCRAMDWSGKAIPDNCQLVEAKGEDTLRFTADRGAGDQASFRLR